MIGTDGLRIDGDRLWCRLTEMAQIGATANGGVCRVALTDEDKRGRDLFVAWCRDAGCTISVDPIGNIFARRPGVDNTLPPVLAGSHLDSQPTGGRFDGVYGVLAGLEVVETLNDHGVTTNAPLEIVAWTNEEGARFAPALTGSGVFTGVFNLKSTLQIKDKAGCSIGDELQRIGYAGEASVGGRPIKAAFEAHIEQGPILEAEGKTIGVVTGVQGMNWYELIIDGQEAHAGPTPMEMRRDPVLGATRILSRLYQLAEEHGPWGRVTFGDFKAEPGSTNTVPGHLTITVDLRHPDQAILDTMDRSFRTIVAEECERANLQGRVVEVWNSPAVVYATECVGAVRDAVAVTGFSAMDIVSGAGHDSVYISRVAPTGMIFVPCENGLSHNEAENADKQDLAAGCDVLLQAMLKLAN